MKSDSKLLHIIGSISRTLLGITFIFSGLVKAIDPLGTTYKIEDYFKAFGGFFNSLLPMAEPLAWCLIAFEFVLGVSLLFNIRTQISSWLALLMMLVMTPITLYLAIVNPISDCGCFGDAVKLSNWQTFWKNIVLLVLVLVLLISKCQIPQTFVWQVEACLAGVALIFVVCFMLYARLNLPIKDFRPYKIGNNISQLMEYPDDAEPDVYETLLIYEKDGKQQTFTVKDYPRGDSTWTFVDQQTKLIKKGYEPPIHDFEIVTLEGDDLTDDILEARRATLIIMYDLKKSRTRSIDKLEELIDQTLELGEFCYILTGSGEQDIDEYCEQHTWLSQERFCQTDPVTLKTIVRANPGVVILEYGTVVDKYNLK